MATINSAATGNFSAGATWVGGVVPTVGDTAVVLAGHVVTIDVNTTCDAVTNANNSGYFVLPDGVTLTADVTGGATAANNYVLQYSGTTSATIVGNVTLTTNTASCLVIRHTGTAGTLNITGNISKTVTPSSAGAVSLANNSKVSITGNVDWNTGTGTGSGCTGIGPESATGITLTIVGNVTAGAQSGSDAINFNSGTCSVTGDVTGGSYAGGDTDGPDGIESANGTVTVTGNVYGGYNNNTNRGNHGVFVGDIGSSTASVTVNGNVYGGDNTNHGIECNGTTTINGDVIGGLSGARGAVFGNTGNNANNAGRHTINGDVYASSSVPGLDFSSGTFITINGSVYDDATGRAAVTGTGRIRINNPSTFFYSARTGAFTYTGPNLNDGTEVLLIDNTINTPPEADVRTGVTYAAATRTGTLAVPDPAAVSIGVPVDNTVGTSMVTAADFATLVGAQIVAAVSAP